MINLDANSRLSKWFVWCCDHLPLTVTRVYGGEGDHAGKRRTGASYIEGGTTLCHVFWAILWVPLLGTAFVSLAVFLFTSVHFLAHRDFIRQNPDAGAVVDVLAYFIPEAFMLGAVVVVGLMILAVIGGSKVGIFRLLWQYLKGMKQRICPLVRFDEREPKRA